MYGGTWVANHIHVIEAIGMLTSAGSGQLPIHEDKGG